MNTYKTIVLILLIFLVMSCQELLTTGNITPTTTSSTIVDVTSDSRETDGEFEAVTIPVNKPAFYLNEIEAITNNGICQEVTIDISVSWKNIAAVEIKAQQTGTSETNAKFHEVYFEFIQVEDGVESIVMYDKREFPSNNTTNEFYTKWFWGISLRNIPDEFTNINLIRIRLVSGDYLLKIKDITITPQSKKYEEDKVSTDYPAILLLKSKPENIADFQEDVTVKDKVVYLLSKEIYYKDLSGDMIKHPNPDEIEITYQLLSGPFGTILEGNRLTIPLPNYGRTVVQIGATGIFEGKGMSATTSINIYKNTPPEIKYIVTPPTSMINWGDTTKTLLGKLEILDPDRELNQKVSYILQIPSWCTVVELLDEVDRQRIGLEIWANYGLVNGKSHRIYLQITDKMEAVENTLTFDIAAPTMTYGGLLYSNYTWKQHSGGSYPHYYFDGEFKIKIIPSSKDPKMLEYVKARAGNIYGRIEATRSTGVGCSPSTVYWEGDYIVIRYLPFEDIEFYKNTKSGTTRMHMYWNYGGSQIFNKNLSLFAALVIRWGD